MQTAQHSEIKAKTLEAAKAPRPPTLQALARQHLEANDGFVDQATESLVDFLIEDEASLRVTIRQIVEEAAASAVGRAMRSDRAAIMAGLSRSASAGRAAVAALAGGIAKSLLDFPLAGGIALRHATRPQVEDQARLYEAAAEDMGVKGRWLRAIAAQLDDRREVGEVFDEAAITKLFETARASWPGA